MFQTRPEEQFHLRLHRARSVVLTSSELVEIRAAQRTFEGAYIRTALGQFSFALVILKIFTEEFYPVGALFAVYGAFILLVATHRRYEGQRQFFEVEEKEEIDQDGAGQTLQEGGSSSNSGRNFKKKFRTSGDTVALMTIVSLGAYVALLVLTRELVR